MPRFAPRDLRPVGDLIALTLEDWDIRAGAIDTAYGNRPDRLPGQMLDMEERTALAFAGLINEVRQRELGIERYVWVTQGDHKVRSAHAALQGQVFDWEHAPEEGHPGQAINCRCRAKPIVGGMPGVVLAQVAVAPPSVIPFAPVVRGGIRALTATGGTVLTALEAHGLLKQWSDGLDAAAIQRAARIRGFDLGTLEGGLAAYSYETFYNLAYSPRGFYSGSVPNSVEGATIAGEAAALFAMSHPDVAMLAQHGEQAALKTMWDAADRAWAGYLDRQLTITVGEWSEGWIEFIPILTEEERRLGQLPGFTAEQQEIFILADPILDDLYPIHTGHPPEALPTGNILPNPIDAPIGPHVVTAKAVGEHVTEGGNTIRAHGPQNGEEYMKEKAHDDETIDEIINSPAYEYPSKKGDLRHDQPATVYVGKSGDWVMRNDLTKEIFQMNDRFNRKQNMPD